MTREEALNEYENAGQMISDIKRVSAQKIDELVEKRQNLRKIIFMQQMVPQKLIPRHDRMQGNVRSNKPLAGATSNKIFKCLQDHGGELLAKEVATLCDITEGNAGATLRRLVELHYANKRLEGTGNQRHAYYSVAVHRDTSELNHE